LESGSKGRKSEGAGWARAETTESGHLDAALSLTSSHSWKVFLIEGVLPRGHFVVEGAPSLSSAIRPRIIYILFHY